MTAQFQLTSVRKRYGKRTALHVEELTIWPGRVYVLTGANGSGKTTLLSILAFLTRPEVGNVAFAGERVRWKQAELAALRKKVTLLHQAPYLFGGSVFSNIAFGLRLRNISADILRRTVAESLELVGLPGFAERNAAQLSGGETRRVALARALALKPEILLFDEPLANLDRHSSEVIERLIADLPGRGTTVVVATHDFGQCDRVGGEVIHLVEGRLEPDPGRHPASNEWETVDLCQPLTMPAV
jgi:tungstate transport system ATP-binding protein